jgi:hypothetical protein
VRKAADRGVVAGVVRIASGAAAIALGANGKSIVSKELNQQQIAGTPDMTPAAVTAEGRAECGRRR